MVRSDSTESLFFQNLVDDIREIKNDLAGLRGEVMSLKLQLVKGGSIAPPKITSVLIRYLPIMISSALLGAAYVGYIMHTH